MGKMKIVRASRLDDIRRERDEWDSKNAEQKAKFDAQIKRYDEAVKAVTNGIVAHIEETLVGVDIYNKSIDVDAGWKTLTVRVKGGKNHDENSALTWEWKVSLGRDGNIVRDSSSWSGMQVNTPAQVQDLKNIATAIERLSTIDWDNLLNVQIPEHEDYITERASIGTRPNFEDQEIEAELSNLVGTNVGVEGAEIGGNSNRRAYWYIIVAESAKQFQVIGIHMHTIRRIEEGDTNMTIQQLIDREKQYPTRVSKEKFLSVITKPLVKKEF